MIRRIALLIIAGLAATHAPAQEAEPRWYQVEVVVFLNETAGKVAHEDWSRDPGRPDLQDAVALQPIPEAAAGLMPFQILAPDELELGDIMEKLQRSGHYRPLLHTGWRQPVTDDQTVFPPVLIEAPLEAPIATETSEGAPQPAGAEPSPSSGMTANEPAPSQVLPLAPPEVQPATPTAGVEGIIRLRVARFLHLDVDLLYRKELPLLPEMTQSRNAPGERSVLTGTSAEQGNQPQPFVSGLMADFLGLAKTFFQPYRLNEQRRMRRDELHYFDHPQFGVLAKVSAYEPPPTEPAPAETPAQPAPLPVPVTDPGKATPQPLR